MMYSSTDAYLTYNKQNILSSLKTLNENLADVSSTFRNEREKILTAVRKCEEYDQVHYLQYHHHEEESQQAIKAFQSLRNSIGRFTKKKIEYLEVIRKYSREILFGAELFRDDKDVISEALKLHGHALSSFELLKRSIKKTPGFSYNSPTSDGSSRTICSALSNSSLCSQTTLSFTFSCTSTSNKNIRITDHRSKGIASLWIEKEEHLNELQRNLKRERDRGVLLSVVGKEDLALKYISTTFRNDPEIVLRAVRKNGCALRYASETIKRNKGIALAAVAQNGEALKYISKELQNDTDVVFRAVQKRGSVIKYATESILNNKKIITFVVSKNGRSLKYASSHLKDDKEVVLAAVRNYGRALRHASVPLRCNKDVVQTAMKVDPYAWTYALGPIKNCLHTIAVSATYLKISMKDHESFTLDEYLSEKLMKSIKFHAHLDNSDEIILASKLGLKWDNAIKAFGEDSLYSLDRKTNLFPFMLAASSNNADLSTVFSMMRKSADLVRFYDNTDEVESLADSCVCS